MYMYLIKEKIENFLFLIYTCMCIFKKSRFLAFSICMYVYLIKEKVEDFWFLIYACISSNKKNRRFLIFIIYMYVCIFQKN